MHDELMKRKGNWLYDGYNQCKRQMSLFDFLDDDKDDGDDDE